MTKKTHTFGIQVWLLFVVMMAVIMSITPIIAQDLPPCDERLTVVHDVIAVDTSRYCIEWVIEASEGGELAFTALAAGDNGTLYAARPLTGEVFALTDHDGDGLPETPERIIDGLTLPNALAYVDGSLYIAGGDSVYRWREDGYALEMLADALPQIGEGYWTGGLTVGEDGRIFIGLGANCDLCEPDEGRAAVWEFSAEADENPRIIARGLRYPQALYVQDDILWMGDVSHDALERGRYDEINRLPLSAIFEHDQNTAHFGWPYCLGDSSEGLESQVDVQPFDCESVQSPLYALPSHSTPTAMTVYNADVFPWLQGKLLLTLAGSASTSPLEGYALIGLTINADQTLSEPTFIVPFVDNAQTFAAARGINRTLQLDGQGFWPHHLYGLTVSPEGWIYFSAGGGRIYALRPR